jgi:hypothetical protein
MPADPLLALCKDLGHGQQWFLSPSAHLAVYVSPSTPLVGGTELSRFYMTTLLSSAECLITQCNLYFTQDTLIE